MKNIRLYCILFLLIFHNSIFSSYISPKTNFLGYLKYAIKFETKRPYYLKKARKLFFKDGWNTIAHNPRAIKRNTNFEFYIKRKRDIKIYIDIENNNFIRLKRSLFLELKLNDNIIDKIKIDNFYSTSLKIPAKYLHVGINKLKFSALGKTPLMMKDSNQFPGIWYILKDLYIENMPDKGDKFVSLNNAKKDVFYQPSNSKFIIAVNPYEISGIEFTSALLKKEHTDGYLTIKEKREGKTKILIKRRVYYGKSFITRLKFNRREGNRILEFSFDTSEENSFLVWRSFFLLKNKKNVTEKSSSFVFKKIKKPKNIFIIVLDAARYDLIGQKVKGIEVMPNINKFSKTAYNFKNYYANASYTGTCVTSMFSGLLPEVHGVIYPSNPIPDKIKMLQDYLKDEGFKSYAFIGNFVPIVHNLLRKFNVIYKIFVFKQYKLLKNSYNDVKYIIKIIKKRKKNEKKYFYIHLLPPHQPYNPPSKFKKIFKVASSLKNKAFDLYSKDFVKSQYKSYLNNAHYGDVLVGTILKLLKKRGLFDSSIIIILSDHGEGFAEHNKMAHGSTIYNEMIHVPLMIKLPFQTNKVSVNKLCSHIDFTPTILDLLGIRKHKFFQGFSMFASNNNLNKTIYASVGGKDIYSAVFFDKYKYIYNSGLESLFNLSKDTKETKNINYSQKYTLLSLKQKLFVQYFKNIKIKNRLKIKPKIIIKKIWEEKLKTLGYIEK